MDLKTVSLNDWARLLKINKERAPEERKPNIENRKIWKKEQRFIVINDKYLRKKEAELFVLLLNGIEKNRLVFNCTMQQRTIDTYLLNAVKRFEVKNCRELIELLK